ncbi:metal-dependent hydrolase [Halomarina ordinaria]|uniref:Metal-dependent hydrolase n=1 Tax=Halomarina ordinaria TaxID=3033939 RepID=A0ABD5U7T5_9EURY|nr:metal-dependent hydrolase [Halomarina sp. PSRA2]
MNKDGHVLNGLLLGVGLGFVLEPSGDAETVYTVVAVTVPVVLGALFPDVDTAFGTHRKTLHNLPVLGLFVAFPAVFGNLHYVWVGILTHYVLDVVGSKRGIALFYPLPKEYDFPTGVATSSRYANAVTLAITAVELAVAYALVHLLPPAVASARAALPPVPGLA